MKIAICFSGQIRSGQRALDTYLKKFIDKDLDIDTFAHTWTHDTRSLMVGEEKLQSLKKNDPYIIRRVPQDEIYDISSKLDLKNIIVEDFLTYWEKHRTLIVHPNVVAQTHSWRQSLNAMFDYSKEHSVKYDIVVKLRFDLIYNGHYTLSQILKDVLDNKVDSFFAADSFIANNPNDIIYIATPEVMLNVANRYDKLLKENLYSNQMMASILSYYNLTGISIQEILSKKSHERCYFSILRNECPFDPTKDFLKCRDFWVTFYQNFGTVMQIKFPDKIEPLSITCRSSSKHLNSQDMIKCIKIVKNLYNYAPEHLVKEAEKSGEYLGRF